MRNLLPRSLRRYASVSNPTIYCGPASGMAYLSLLCDKQADAQLYAYSSATEDFNHKYIYSTVHRCSIDHRRLFSSAFPLVERTSPRRMPKFQPPVIVHSLGIARRSHPSIQPMRAPWPTPNLSIHIIAQADISLTHSPPPPTPPRL